MPLGKCFAISPITGYSVVEASDGLEALGGLKEDSVDIVISDFALPKIHGLALVREIRSRSPAHRCNHHLGVSGPEAGRVILEREAEFVAKPLQLSHLAATIYGVLLRKQMNQLVARKVLGCQSRASRSALVRHLRQSSLADSIVQNCLVYPLCFSLTPSFNF